MNNNQDKKRHGQALKRALYRKKLCIDDCCGRARKLNADEIAQALDCSKSYAHKLVNGQAKLSTANKELLLYKFLGVIPGFEGYYMSDNTITAPNGYQIQIADLENISLMSQLIRSYERDTRDLKEEIKRLQARIEWQNAKLAQPEQLRKYTNSRVIRYPFNKKEA